MIGRRRHRLRIALVVILSLLLQQLAIAGYDCTTPAIASTPVLAVDDCATMAMPVEQQAPALCAKHCAPDLAVVADQSSPNVPPLALPAVDFAPVLLLPTLQVACSSDVPVHRSDPPPRLRYCSLQI